MTNHIAGTLVTSPQPTTIWLQHYDPLENRVLSTLGGVRGKMIDAQSIVVAGTTTNVTGQEGAMLHYVFWHSVVLAALVGLAVYLQAYVPS